MIFTSPPTLSPKTLSRRSLGAALLAAVAVKAARAADAAVPAPVGKPILTVSGHISRPNLGDTAAFDRAALEALGVSGFETTTPWYDGQVRFDGVPMTRVMDAVGASGSTVRAIALNDYTTDIPISDFARFGTLLATKRNGAYMPVRDKGPLFIIYPFDSTSELQTHLYYGRSAWQVTQLVIV